MAELLFDFDNLSDAKRSLKRVAQAMLRAGQPVVSNDFDPKVKRTSGVSYRQALLTLASGQTITLMIKLTGDVFRVLLNGAVLPIKNQDGLKAIAEIAAAAERSQAKFQAAQARKKVELPKGIRTAAPRLEQALQARTVELDTQIAERTAERDALKAELGDAALDAVTLDAARKHNQKGYAFYVVAGGKIESGWEYDEDAKEHKAENLPDKLKAGAKVLKKAGLKALGLDPDDNADWLSAAALDAVELNEAVALAASVIGGDMLDSADLAGALATLRIALDTVETNAPINEAAGNVEQAALERENAASFREAIQLLDAASAPGEKQSNGFPRQEPDGKRYNRDQYDLVPTDEHGEMPPVLMLKPDAVPVDELEDPSDEDDGEDYQPAEGQESLFDE